MEDNASVLDSCIGEEEEYVLLEHCRIKGHGLIFYKDKANIVYDIYYQVLGRLDGNKIIYYTYRLA